MDTPLISVILATYNGARYLREAIDSVLAQDFIDLELIIIDDASTDSTPEILLQYRTQDSRIKVVRNKQNLKLVSSLNKGIELAQWEYIARIDDDDIWSDVTKLSQQLKKFEENASLAIIGTFGSIIDESGVKTGKYITHKSGTQSVRKGFWLRNQLIHTSILAKKSVLQAAWLYREEWLYIEDFDLWLRVLELGYDIDNLSEYCVDYRVRIGNTTSKKYHRMQWLLFRRLLEETQIYPHFFRKIYCLLIRWILILLPIQIVRYLK